jgi:hypothetical protein
VFATEDFRTMRPTLALVVSAHDRTTARPNDLSTTLRSFVAHREVSTPNVSSMTTRPVPPPPPADARGRPAVEQLPVFEAYRMPVDIVAYLGPGDGETTASRSAQVIELVRRLPSSDVDVTYSIVRRCA